MSTEQVKLAAVLDVETTGLSAQTCDIIELAIAVVSYDSSTGEIIDIVEEYEEFNMPSTPIFSYITNLTGITNEMVKNKTLDDKKVESLLTSVSAIIAHNASFDRSFLLKRYPSLFNQKWHCSMRAVKWKEYGFPNKKLTTLLDHHNIEREHAHRAMDDVKGTIDLLRQQNPSGEPYFSEVLKKTMSKPKKTAASTRF
ncbi:exonuclease domain-containing protein [Priestia aryabhattai]|uniref:exonuclease domain-containing protein n=1 Tax=Priestia aryabhattai TaxID=412384 RepID=UPI0008DCB4E1|nr:exonuclease domain-containing protein [Priestia aryabhattai]MBX9966642.1 DNA polymerase III subunit epsilon [Priestia aryabhattai]MBZ6487848.1 DNA polymerase III subunit epsilon [Priestia aryabhattai]MDH3114702.1 exonuclease domain-containing protein [Priestia aryabhattai]MDH3126397.1 exonuclease domain-containing protein [Priestia aryabhattai]MDH3133350.1 exonuclease domain-containing protein [Priestia aryabhattai]